MLCFCSVSLCESVKVFRGVTVERGWVGWAEKKGGCGWAFQGLALVFGDFGQTHLARENRGFELQRVVA